jgi:hypothetical protein
MQQVWLYCEPGSNHIETSLSTYIQGFKDVLDFQFSDVAIFSIYIVRYKHATWK